MFLPFNVLHVLFFFLLWYYYLKTELYTLICLQNISFYCGTVLFFFLKRSLFSYSLPYQGQGAYPIAYTAFSKSASWSISVATCQLLSETMIWTLWNPLWSRTLLRVCSRNKVKYCYSVTVNLLTTLHNQTEIKHSTQQSHSW